MSYKRLNKKQISLLSSLLIGKDLEVVKSSDPNKIGLKGKIIFEDKKRFILKNNQKYIIIPKRECLFKIDGILIPGKILEQEIWDRIKKYW